MFKAKFNEELMFLNLKYVFKLEYVRQVMWSIQQDFGKEAAEDFKVQYQSTFN